MLRGVRIDRAPRFCVLPPDAGSAIQDEKPQFQVEPCISV